MSFKVQRKSLNHRDQNSISRKNCIQKRTNRIPKSPIAAAIQQKKKSANPDHRHKLQEEQFDHKIETQTPINLMFPSEGAGNPRTKRRRKKSQNLGSLSYLKRELPESLLDLVLRRAGLNPQRPVLLRQAPGHRGGAPHLAGASSSPSAPPFDPTPDRGSRRRSKHSRRHRHHSIAQKNTAKTGSNPNLSLLRSKSHKQ